MQFFQCACYLAGLGVLSFVLGRLVPKTWFDYTRFPTAHTRLNGTGRSTNRWVLRAGRAGYRT